VALQHQITLPILAVSDWILTQHGQPQHQLVSVADTQQVVVVADGMSQTLGQVAQVAVAMVVQIVLLATTLQQILAQAVVELVLEHRHLAQVAQEGLDLLL
jgi:hypothetical protein